MTWSSSYRGRCAQDSAVDLGSEASLSEEHGGVSVNVVHKTAGPPMHHSLDAITILAKDPILKAPLRIQHREKLGSSWLPKL